MARNKERGQESHHAVTAESDKNNLPTEDQSASAASLETLLSEVQNDPLFRQYDSIVEKFVPGHKNFDLEVPRESQTISDEETSEHLHEPSDESDTNLSENATCGSLSGSVKKKTSLAALKKTVMHPELIEWWDADAKDPALLYTLKSAPGVVPVPASWQGRHGQSSIRSQRPYRLPKNIKETGIMTLRDVVAEDSDTLRQKMRERVQPKLGRLDMDYKKLHSAFFKFQAKPELSKYGQAQDPLFRFDPDLRPGNLSERLRSALGLKSDMLVPWAAILKRNPYKSWPPKTQYFNLGKRWGQMILDDEGDFSSEDEDPADEYEEEGEKDGGKIEEESASENEAEVRGEQANGMPEARKELYREVKTSTGGSSYLGPTPKYNF